MITTRLAGGTVDLETLPISDLAPALHAVFVGAAAVTVLLLGIGLAMPNRIVATKAPRPDHRPIRRRVGATAGPRTCSCADSAEAAGSGRAAYDGARVGGQPERRRRSARPGRSSRTAARRRRPAPSTSSSPRLTCTASPPRCIANARVASSCSTVVRSNDGSVSSGCVAPQRGQLAVDARASARPRGDVELGPVELRALEGLRVLRVGHDGRVPAHARANSAIRPSAVALPSSGSGWQVKNCHGVRRRPLLAHEEHRRERAGQGQQRGAARAGRRRATSVIRSPTARLPIWSWFWLQTTRRQVGIAAVSIGAPWSRAAERATRCRRGRSRARAPWPARRAARSRRSSRSVSPVSATCTAWWKSSLHCASRP